jgi:hypothetical protein
MAIPILHHLSSPDLERGASPADPTSCAVTINAEIGPLSGGAENFAFIVATPDHVLPSCGVRWGRGYLIVDRFSWEAVEAALNKLLLFADRPTWKESVAQLGKELHWEFDGYSEFVNR